MADLVDIVRARLQQDRLSVGHRIALERVIVGLSVRQCARAMGWAHMQWQRVESNQRTLSDDEVARIAAVLGVTDARLRGLQATVTPGWKRLGRPAKAKVAA